MARLQLASQQVVAEVIDGEAIVLDLRVGAYYATDGVGSVVWTAAVEGWDAEAISGSAAAAFPDRASASADVAALLAALVDADLLVGSDEPATSSGPLAWPATYATPTLEKHDDLQDMMQLDPIHDTDATGWPMPAPTSRR